MRFVIIVGFFIALCAQARDVAITLVNDNGHTLIQQTTHQQIRHHMQMPEVQKVPALNAKSYIRGALLATISALSLYSACFLYIAYCARLTERPHYWSLWKKEIPLKVLKEVPSGTIMAELQKDIEKNYENGKAITQCVYAIHEERRSLMHFLSICRMFDRFSLSFIFSPLKQKIHVEDKLERLNFLTKLIESSIQFNVPQVCALN